MAEILPTVLQQLVSHFELFFLLMSLLPRPALSSSPSLSIVFYTLFFV